MLALFVVDFSDVLFSRGEYFLTGWKKSVIPCSFFPYTGFSGGTHYATL